MNCVHGNPCLFRRGELMDAVAEIKYMAMGALGIFQQTLYSCP
jgi:hypothetical protein